jgi:hypothetical protein
MTVYKMLSGAAFGGLGKALVDLKRGSEQRAPHSSRSSNPVLLCACHLEHNVDMTNTMSADAVTTATLCEICEAIPFGEVLARRQNPLQGTTEKLAQPAGLEPPPLESDHDEEVFRHHNSKLALASSAISCPICKVLDDGLESKYGPKHRALQPDGQVWAVLRYASRESNVSKSACAMLRCIVWSPLNIRDGLQIYSSTPVPIFRGTFYFITSITAYLQTETP